MSKRWLRWAGSVLANSLLLQRHKQESACMSNKAEQPGRGRSKASKVANECKLSETYLYPDLDTVLAAQHKHILNLNVILYQKRKRKGKRRRRRKRKRKRKRKKPTKQASNWWQHEPNSHMMQVVVSQARAAPVLTPHPSAQMHCNPLFLSFFKKRTSTSRKR